MIEGMDVLDPKFVKEQEFSLRSRLQESLTPVCKCRPYMKNPCFCFLVLLFLCSMGAVIILLGTEIYDDSILKILTLEEGGTTYNIWRKPEWETAMIIYPFNYTNIENIKTEKPNVQELGPYVFKEKTEKVDIVFNNNGTVSFSENRTHRYEPDASIGELDDLLFTPNVPFMSAAAKGAERGVLTQFALATVLKGLDSRPFLPVTVADFVEGFDDNFSTFARRIASILKEKVPPKYGMLVDRMGFNPDRMTIGTGKPDIDSFGIVYNYNGVSVLDYWETEECNVIQGSDGAFFPAQLVQKKSKIYLYIPKFCRRMPLIYTGVNKEINDFPTKRFYLPYNIFSTPEENPENACFYADKKQPSGTFSTSKCTYGAPISISFPHFLYGEKGLRMNVTGLNPNTEKHEFYVDLHSMFGVPIEGRMRFQLNVVVHHCPFLTELKEIPEGTVLPVAWIDVVIGGISGRGKEIIYHATYTLYYIKQAIIWTSLGIMLLSFVGISSYIFKRK